MIKIRQARREEAGAIALCHVEADWQTYAPIFGARTVKRELSASLARWEAALAAGDKIWVAQDDGRAAILGFAHLHGDWMGALYLLEAWRRRGIGTALLSEVRRRAGEQGFERIRFQVLEENRAAIAFYEARGGRSTGKVVVSEEGKDAWRDLVFEVPTDQALGDRGLKKSRKTPG
ncbi:MAG: GNAT family N-acetyltransferase [Caulobacteraceae bacterium]